MTGKENIDRYIDARKKLDELYDLTNWVANKLGSLYIASSGYYDFKGIKRSDDLYEITVDWTSMGETYGEMFTVPADLCEKCFCKETRYEAYAELKKIKDKERRIRLLSERKTNSGKSATRKR